MSKCTQNFLQDLFLIWCFGKFFFTIVTVGKISLLVIIMGCSMITGNMYIAETSLRKCYFLLYTFDEQQRYNNKGQDQN